MISLPDRIAAERLGVRVSHTAPPSRRILSGSCTCYLPSFSSR